ncbi:hypothetical protein CspeluHIS016_0900150 [Cutaneotrichosporon spelunceum]|uniref:Uncharacterized protein n=1 Tax=Cutaneotrichosporon spelunceum TaxID=1672016 RepID=A0AAD3YF44_9TREE|nr:hypothetical protein CspeluHIS016_0900150 [Cutaneotrichosporon spelunceum]
MTDLTVITSSPPPPSYREECESMENDTLTHEEKSVLQQLDEALTPDEKSAPHYTASTSSTAFTSPVPQYEKACIHDTKLSCKGRALRVGLVALNPAVGIAVALCPHSRRRTCRTCGEVVLVPVKRAFC